MWKTILGLIGPIIADILRGLVSDHAARKDLKRLGEERARNEQLSVRIELQTGARKIEQRIDDEDDLGSLLSNL